MKHISILVPDGENNLSSIVGAYKILTRANRIWEEKSNRRGYKVELVGISKEVEFFDGLCTVKPHTHISGVSRTNLVVISSVNHNYNQAIEVNKPLVEWIKLQFANGAEVASVCTGAFLLAAAGLLNGRICSTHWAFAIFSGHKSHGDEVIRMAQDYIEKNVFEKVSIEDLALKLALSRRNFDRRFIKATGYTPLEYIQRVKVEAAKKSFETNRKSINEVMYEVGYSDIKAFREVFKKVTGMSPLDYRNRYNKEAMI